MGRVRLGLRRLRARTAAPRAFEDDGFTIIEMVVALTILAVALLSLAYGIFGGMTVLQAGRHQTSFLELANAEAEAIRALNYAEAGVNSNDPDLATAYPPVAGINKHNGRTAAIINPPTAATPPAVEVVADSPVSGRPVPYTIRRWVTWTDPAAGTTQRFKRIDVEIEWTEPNGRSRSVDYTTLFYPGNLGPIPGSPPTAVMAVTPTIGFRSSTSFAFDGSGSTDPNSLALTYDWDFGDGTSGTGVSPTHTYTTVGRKTITLTVTNTADLSSTPVSQNVLVGTAPGIPAPPGNRPPTAVFTATPTSGTGPLSVNVDATASSDPDGDPLAYVWDWGDTTVGSGPSAAHVFSNPGTYTLTLTVNDPAGATSSASTTISVVGTTCTVNSASFKNPGSNATNNSIDIRNSDRPENIEFVFTAVTNPSCNSVTVALPTQSGNFTATLALLSSTSITHTWGVTTTNNSKYNTGNTQSGTFTAVGTTGNVPHSITFRVFR